MTVLNPSDKAEEVKVRFVFPSTSAIYDDFVFTINGVRVTPDEQSGEGVVTTVELAPAEQAEIQICGRLTGPGGELLVAGGQPAFRSPRGRYFAVSFPGAVFLRLLL